MEENHNIAGPASEAEAETKRPRRREDELATIKQMLAERDAQFEQLREMLMNTVQQRDAVPDEYPVYELTEPFYSPDDIYYPAETLFTDLTNGEVTPPLSAIPRNRAAEVRLAEEWRRQPGGGALDDSEGQLCLEEATAQLEKQEFPTKTARGRAILKLALDIKEERCGSVLPKSSRLPVQPSRAPMMANTRISGSVDPRGMSGIAQRHSAVEAGSRTRVHQVPTPNANRQAPVFGSVQSQPLGA